MVSDTFHNQVEAKTMSTQNLELISADYRAIENRGSLLWTKLKRGTWTFSEDCWGTLEWDNKPPNASSTCWRQFPPSVSSAVMAAYLFTVRTHLACNKHYCNKQQQTKTSNAPSGTKKVSSHDPITRKYQFFCYSTDCAHGKVTITPKLTHTRTLRLSALKHACRSFRPTGM